MNADLVVFGEDWERHPSSTQHLVKRLARDRQVVWVNSIGMRRPRLSGTDLARVSAKLGAWVGGRKKTNAARPRQASVPEKRPVEVVAPMAMPWPGSRIAERINKIALSQQIGKALAAKNMKQPILWASLPTALPAVGELGERAVVYYCGDDFGALAGVDHEPVLEMEQRLVAKADLILAASPTLAERFPREKTMYLPHGVDVSLFSTPSPRAHDLPSGQPVAGFYGSLSDWIDVDLLATVAQRLPEWRFVFIGDVRTDVTALMRCANVQLLGARPHAELSRYSQHWSASMLPFRNCPQITACNPLKLREYLAAGRPLVSTSFPALGPYATLIHEANTPDTFAAALVHSCNEGAEQAAARRASIAGESWDVRAEAVANALRNL